MTQQRWNAKDYANNARFVADLGSPVLELLAPQAGERILDVGCGDGALTRQIAATGARVVGVDSSEELLVAAKELGLDARLCDARQLAFEQEFDAVFSNATLHWVPDQGAVVRAVRRALVPGGRFVGEFGGHGCVATVCSTLAALALERGVQLRFPWTFPTVARFERCLRDNGLVPERVELIPRPTHLPSGMSAWLDTFAQPLFAQFPATDRAELKQRVLSALSWSLSAGDGWTADYTRLRFVARRSVSG
jgi:SAM-dependent methyltransferase